MNRSIAIVAALVGLVVLAPTAAADSGSGVTSAPDPSTTTETTSPTTETPVTVTETPVTTTPATTTTETPATTTETPATTATPTTTTTPTTTAVPVAGTPTTTPTLGTDVPCVTDCIPASEECAGVDCIPSAGGGIPTAVGGAGMLPFTGIEDTIAPILLALTVVLGGVVAWRWAQLRESVARDAATARPLPAKDAARSGYAAAMRRQLIEHRARQVFTPRVA